MDRHRALGIFGSGEGNAFSYGMVVFNALDEPLTMAVFRVDAFKIFAYGPSYRCDKPSSGSLLITWRN
jgi:hypothetical protein